jgi:peptide/nickel transport system permease protein
VPAEHPQTGAAVIAVVDTTPVVAPGVSSDAHWSRSLGLAIGLAVVGLAAIVFGTTILNDGAMFVRVVLVIVGLVAVYQAITIGVHHFKPHADVAFGLSAIWLVGLVSAAILAPLLPLGEHKDTAKALREPSLLRPDLLSDHPFGTNNFSLDILSRVIYGARASLLMALAAVVIGLVVGGLIGMVSGYLGGKADWAIGILNNTLLAFPPLVLLLALATVMERDARNIALALGILAIPVNVRLARANTLAVAEQGFVTAARAMGASRRRVLFKELLPNVAPPLVSYGLVLMALLIVAESSLSFLGLGVQPPSPSWGNMISEGNGGQFEQYPHVVIVPGVVVFLTVFAFNLVGGRARSKWDKVGSGQ